MNLRLLATSSIAALALLVAPLASAQEQQVTAQTDSPQWLKDRRYNEGIGIRVGDFELHPGIAGEVGYDSNWFLRSTQPLVLNSPVIESIPFRITPSLSLSTLGPQRRQADEVVQPPAIAFRAGINATAFAFIDVSGVSGTQNDIARDANISGAADARLDILPARPVSGSVSATYAHVVYPNQQDADPNQSYTHENVTVGGDLAFQPGMGTLDWHGGYQFSGAFFDNNSAATFTNYSSMAYTRGRWRFRPRTALLFDGSVGFYNYTNQSAAAAAGLVGSTPVRARIGMNGLVTERFAVQGLIGWGASFEQQLYNVVPQYDSLIAQAELKWFLAASPGLANATELGLALSSIAVGYTRDFQTSYIGNFYGLDRGYLRFNYFFAGRFLATLEGGGAAIEYPTTYFFAPTPIRRATSFTDARIDATLFGEYRLADTLGVNATFRYTQNFSSERLQEASGTDFLFGLAWQRFEAYLGVRWFM
jgi:hypothetical protein